MKNNKAFIVNKLGAAILDAEMNVKTKCKVPLMPRKIMWEDAPEEMRNNPNITWITDVTCSGRGKKYCFYKHTKEEKEEIEAYQRQKLLDKFDFILNNYGWKYAEKFYILNKKDFEKYNAKINLKIPHCRYTNNGQCDISCFYFYGGKCSY